ncbi:MAG: SpoIIE family protein phosphatase [Actinomycetota bacterium]|nr:SpoIIE family protein phosphatase [Actinomycetota bacterium]
MRLSLRWKIVGGFGVLLILIVVLGWVTLSLFGSLRTVQHRVLDQAVPELVTVDEIVRSYTAQSAAVRGFLIEGQSSLLDQYRKEVQTSRSFQHQAQRLFGNSGQDHRLLNELVTAGQSFQHLIDHRVIPLAGEGRRRAAFHVLGRVGTPLISQIDADGSVLRSLQNETVAASEQDLSAHSSRTIGILLAVTGGALLLGIVLAVVLPRRLVVDLQRLVDATRAIGRGDFDQQIRIESGDEVEELATRFGEMQSGLKRLQQLAMQDRELEIASGIQRNLLQRLVPETPGFVLLPLHRQANLVGGDWYDIDYEGRSLTLAVGDASGKGIGAALMATVLLSVLRAERRLGADAERVIQRTNEALREAIEVDGFTTLIYATIEAETGEVRWLNMGHPSPFLLRSSKRMPSVQLAGYYIEGPRNKALGWFQDPGLSQTVARVDPGDRLVFFTDGFLEAKSAEGEVFGERRFAEAILKVGRLPLDSMGDLVVGEVERFAAGKLDDDLTMLVVEWQGIQAPVNAQATRVDEVETGEPLWHSRR